MTKLFTVDDYRSAARRTLPHMVFDYLEGGAEAELLLQENRAAFGRIQFAPKRLTDVSARDQSIELFGRRLESPLIVGPTGLNGAFRPAGDIALARAAAAAGLPFVLSTPAQSSIEEIAATSDGDLWFQLYVVERGLAERLVQRALSAGYRTLVLTTDVAVNGIRERDVRNGFGVPFSVGPRVALDGAMHPAWSFRFLRAGMPKLANFADDAGTTESQYAVMHRQMDASFGWSDLAALRDMWPHTLLVKGILRADDAARAVDAGADGVVVSNHGGRQLDHVQSPLEVLEDVVDRINAPVLVDSGFRRGSDVVKAIALGASAVLLGRAPLYGLSARGEKGVTAVLDIVHHEIDTTLALTGARSISELDRSFLRHRVETGPGSRLE